MNIKPKEILEGLQHFRGSEICYQIPLTMTRFTEGLKYLAYTAECYWLITDVSIFAKSLLEQSRFITIVFKRLPEEKQDYSGYEAELVYSDGDNNILETHRYHVTDFPLEELPLYFVGNTLMPPNEY